MDTCGRVIVVVLLDKTVGGEVWGDKTILCGGRGGLIEILRAWRLGFIGVISL